MCGANGIQRHHTSLELKYTCLTIAANIKSRFEPNTVLVIN